MNREILPAPSETRASEAPQRDPGRPAPPGVTRDEVDLLLRRAGLTLNAGQKADLAVAFQNLVALAARLPRARPLSDEPAFVFHPAMPGPEAEPSPRTATRVAQKPAAEAKPKTKPAPAAAAKRKAKARPAVTRTAKRSARPAGRR